MILFVGLGNPGPRYLLNRHNVGFLAVDEIANRHGFDVERQRFQGYAREGRFQSDGPSIKTLILKPATYMNESGRCVVEAAHFYKIEPQDIVVFHDELDLEPGKVRIKSGGGHAGHNGLRSLHAYLGSDFRRVRIGIGHPGHKDAVERYVLQDFSKADAAWLEPLLDAIGEAAPLLAQGKDNSFMNAVFLKTHPEEAEPKKLIKGDGKSGPAEPQ